MKTVLKRSGLVAALGMIAVLAGCAHQRGPQPTTGTQAQQATPTGHAAPARDAPELETADLGAELRADAPLRYVVKPGDTLWDIAGYYLRDPWYWPQLWYDNPDIANPHRIYPGEVLVLTRGGNGPPQLRRAQTERLSPRIREQPVASAIATIPLDAIRAFLTGPRIVTAEELADAPYIVSFADEHLVGGAGIELYVRDAPTDGPRQYSVVRPAGPYTDPDSGEILGQQAVPVGALHIDEFGDIATATITHSDREALTGDRLLPAERENLVHDFYPHAPATPITGRIISVYDGVSAIGQYQVVTLDRGRSDGLERGHVLNVYEAGRTVLDPVAGGQVTLPERRAGELLVFKTDDQVSFAVIMRARRAIHIQDRVRSPGA